MSTQSLTDQLRLLEEEIERLQDLPDRLGKGGLYRAAKKLLAVAKGLEQERDAESDEVELKTIAMKSMHQTEEQLAAERAALRAENEALQETVRTLLASAFPSKKEHPGMYAAWQHAEAALASLSK